MKISSIIFASLILIFHFTLEHKSTAWAYGPVAWQQVWQQDLPSLDPSWGRPELLSVSADSVFGNIQWRDSLNVSPDGQSITYMKTKGDIYAWAFGIGPWQPHPPAPDIYISYYPFTTEQKINLYFMSEPLYGEGGPMQAENGDWYYNSNKDNWEMFQSGLQGIYKNNQPLPIQTANGIDQNPHYNTAKDQLWFDNGDKDIYLIHDAEASNYQNTPQLAPAPINSPIAADLDMMPWLSPNGHHLYFASTRLGTLSIFSSHLNRYGRWSPPKFEVGKVKIGVGEVTLTADGKTMFYEQIVKHPVFNFHTVLFFRVQKK